MVVCSDSFDYRLVDPLPVELEADAGIGEGPTETFVVKSDVTDVDSEGSSVANITDMTRKLSDSHYVNNQEIFQEQVRNMVFGRSPKASG